MIPLQAAQGPDLIPGQGPRITCTMAKIKDYIGTWEEALVLSDANLYFC